MRNSIILSILAFINVIALSSCEKVIDIDLNESDNKLVIEGKINNQGECTVKLTQAKSYNQNNEFPGVTDAIVVIFDNQGNSDTLEQGIAGMYYSDQIIGTPGVTYSLNVNWNNQNYTSVCRMPELVQIDSLSLRKEVFFVDTTLITIIHFKDPANSNNYYRYLYSINDLSANTDYFVESDKFYNGLDVETRIPIFELSPNGGPGGGPGGPGGPGNPGPGPITPDTLKIEMWGIDKSMELYYRTLSATIDASSGQQAAPANPESNITGNALGYFSAYSISKASIVIE
jgi:Domain of unknown function (DUF4249)